MSDYRTPAVKEDFFRNYDYYWLKYTMDRGIGEQVRYLLTGHSLARFGINDRDVPGLINLAFLSQDYYYSYRIIEKALDNIHTLKHIVIGTGYLSPYMDLSRTRNKNELGRIVRVYGRYFQDIHHMDAREYERMRSEILPGNHDGPGDAVSGNRFSEDSFFRLYCERKDDYFCKERDRQSLSEFVWADITEDERYCAAKRRTDYHNRLTAHQETFEENSSVLQRIARLCRAKGVLLSLAVFPSNRYYRSTLDPRLQEGYRKQIALIPEEYRPLQWDLFDSEEFDSVNDFIDTDHLNDRGASKMTAMMRDYLGDV